MFVNCKNYIVVQFSGSLFCIGCKSCLHYFCLPSYRSLIFLMLRISVGTYNYILRNIILLAHVWLFIYLLFFILFIYFLFFIYYFFFFFWRMIGIYECIMSTSWWRAGLHLGCIWEWWFAFIYGQYRVSACSNGDNSMAWNNLTPAHTWCLIFTRYTARIRKCRVKDVKLSVVKFDMWVYFQKWLEG
jgi:hypothetical protein